MDCGELKGTLLRCSDVDMMEGVVRSWTGRRATARLSRNLVSPIEALLTNGKLAEAAAFSLSLAYEHQDAFISLARQSGVFRASRYRFRTANLFELVQCLRRLADPLFLGAASRAYLDSLLAFYTISDDAAGIYEEVVGAMRERRGRVLATLMLIADHAYESDRVGLRSYGPRGIKERTCELLCGVVSALMTIYRKELGSEDEWCGIDSEQCAPLDGPYAMMVEHGLAIYELMESEVSMDGSAAVARRIPGGVLVKRPPPLDASIRLGYARMEEDIVQHFEAIEEVAVVSGRKSLLLLAMEFHDVLSNVIAVSPSPFGFPCVALLPPEDAILLSNLRGENLFIEELFTQVQMRRYRCEVASLEAFDVGSELSSIDLMRVARLLSVLRDVYYDREKERHFSDDETVASQKLCCMRTVELITLFSSVVGRSKAEKIVSSLLSPTEDDRIDLQYRPFVQVMDWVYFSLSVASVSIHPGNFESGARDRSARLSNGDPPVERVFDLMRHAGFRVEKERKLRILGAPRDTDILALFGDTLYVLEFKNSFVPSNSHELRNTYDHLLKAAEQLEIRKQWFESPDAQRLVWATLGWSDPFPCRVQTGIILSHPLFHGASIGEHPVRAAQDLIDFLEYGVVSIGSSHAKSWEGDRLAPSDLWRYFQPHGPCAEQLACMLPSSHFRPIGSSRLATEDWHLDETIGRAPAR